MYIICSKNPKHKQRYVGMQTGLPHTRLLTPTQARVECNGGEQHTGGCILQVAVQLVLYIGTKAREPLQPYVGLRERREES